MKRILIKLKRPVNIVPYIYKCNNCGSLLRLHEPTQSYYLVKVTKAGPKNCKFCYNLARYSIPEAIGIKIIEEGDE